MEGAMFGSGIIDAVIGTIFIFVFVSLVATSAIEGIEGILKTRAKDLEKGIRNVLDDPSGRTFTEALYKHPLISALFVGDYNPTALGKTTLEDIKKLEEKAAASPTDPTAKKAVADARASAARKSMPLGSRRNLPSYIPGLSFAGALVDVVFANAGNAPGTPVTLATLKTSAAQIPDTKLKEAVLSAIESAGNDVEVLEKNLATWFDTAMDRVSGWYKRRAQMTLFLMGLFAAIVLNVDAITTFTSLKSSPALSAALISQVDQINSDAGKSDEQKKIDIEQVQQKLVELGFPMGWKSGWPGPQFAVCMETEQAPDSAKAVFSPLSKCSKWQAVILGGRTLIGWLITALAVMLGAPFWFDVLAKFMSIRATGKPIEDGAKSAKTGGEGAAGAGGGGGAGSGSAAAPQSS
jgi:hypothetical protein